KKSGASIEAFITAVNDAPVAAVDNYTMVWNTTLTVPAPGVPGTPGYDADDDSAHTADSTHIGLKAFKVTDPASGKLTLNANGSFTYTPTKNFFGTDSFTYKANDGTWPPPSLVDSTLPMSPDSTAVKVTIKVNKK